MEPENIQIAKAILKNKKNKIRGITFVDLKLYCQVLVINTVWSWPKKRHRSTEKNRKPRNEATTTCSINPRQSMKENIQWEKKKKNSLFDKWFWEKNKP